jgi:hypothetical protein
VSACTNCANLRPCVTDTHRICCNLTKKDKLRVFRSFLHAKFCFASGTDRPTLRTCTGTRQRSAPPASRAATRPSARPPRSTRRGRRWSKGRRRRSGARSAAPSGGGRAATGVRGARAKGSTRQAGVDREGSGGEQAGCGEGRGSLARCQYSSRWPCAARAARAAQKHTAHAARAVCAAQDVAAAAQRAGLGFLFPSR